MGLFLLVFITAGVSLGILALVGLVRDDIGCCGNFEICKGGTNKPPNTPRPERTQQQGIKDERS